MMTDSKPVPQITALSALTLATRNMMRAVRFYRALGFEMLYGGEDAAFTSFACGGASYLNVITASDVPQWCWWGRVIFHVNDVDAFHARVVAVGLAPQAAPADAPWGERYFHLTDPDGHELSFATPLAVR